MPGLTHPGDLTSAQGPLSPAFWRISGGVEPLLFVCHSNAGSGHLEGGPPEATPVQEAGV